MRDLASPGRSRTIPPAVGVLLCRPPAAACADRRSAFPCLRVALPRPKPNHPPRIPAVGVLAGRLRRPVPTGPPARRLCAAVGVLLCRPPAAACAERSAFPCPRVALPRAKPNHPPRSRGPSLPAACGGLCRPEVGVPLPARRSAPAEAEPSPPQSGSFSAGRLRRPVPTGGRRSLACASLCPGRSRTIPPAVGVLLCRPPAAACADRSSLVRVALLRAKPNHPPRSWGPSLPAACGGLCRPEVGVPDCLRALWRPKPNHPRAQKTMAANSVRCRRDRGESVKGGHPPFHKKTTRNRNSPPRAGGAQGSSESGAQRLAVRKGGKTPENTDFRDLSRLKPPLRTARPGASSYRRRPSGGCRCA